jgi:hypothetical protein
MNENAMQTDCKPAEPPRSNRAWFKPGPDPRRNLKGRPNRIGALARRAKAGQPLSGRLARLFVPESDLCRYLCNWKARHFSGMLDPRFFRIVDAEMIPARGGILFTITSELLRPVAPGDPIPELVPIWQR